MYLYMHAYVEKKTYIRIGFQNAARSCKVGQNINISYSHGWPLRKQRFQPSMSFLSQYIYACIEV